MSGNIFWKFVLTGVIIFWCLATISPLRDRPFESYIVDQVGAHKEEFKELMERAGKRVERGDAPTEFIALRDMGREEDIDYTRFFPDIDLADVPDPKERNDILLKHILNKSKSNLQLGLDLRGGVGFTLKIAESALEGMSSVEQERQLENAVDIMRERLDGLGVAEPLIRPVGNDGLEIQIPGLTTRDNPEVVESLRKPAKLEFRRVHPELSPATTPEDEYPPGYEVLSMEVEDPQTGELRERRMFVKQIPEATGEIVDEATPSQTPAGGFQVNLRMTGEGADIFRNVTEDMVGEPLAVVLDGKLYSAPTIQETLSRRAQITGNFSQREAIELANVLNNPLSVELRVDEMYEVGPSLAEGTRESSINAAQWGAALVIAFIVAYYFIGGVVAVVSAMINVTIVLGVLASLGATLTLPGVAALLLTLGMGVDANILIFERLREELKIGKSLKNAVASAFEKVTSTIVDANVTTLITATILIWLGTGPVQGFGVTLAIGICASIFCALVVTRFLLDFLVHRIGVSNVLGLHLFRIERIDFFRHRRVAFAASWLLVLAGVLSIATHHDKILGIDFTGGDEMTVAFEEKVPTGELISAAQERELGEINAIYQTLIGEDREVLKLQTPFDQSREILSELQQAFPGADLSETGVTQIGAAVSTDIQWNAIFSIVAALGGILLYVALRFEVGYGVGAVVATIHDALMTVGIFVLLGQMGLLVSGQFSAPMLAAILMIVGYSINDTIVVFDRIREELELNPGTDLKSIINLAISRVFSRSLLTSITTLLAAVSLYVFGAGVINDFSFVFIVGILTGTFSSIFIASPVFYWWHKGDRRHVEERELLPKRYEWESAKPKETAG